MAGKTVVDVSEVGVVVETDGVRQVVGWERVKKVLGPRAAEGERFAGVSDKAWRSFLRLRRGDVAGAEPLLEELYQSYRGVRGPTAATVCEGLARCRAARGAMAAGVMPWMHSRVAKSGPGRDGNAPEVSWIGGEVDAGDFTDEEYGLCPMLPPVWIKGVALEALVASSGWKELTSMSGAVGEIAAMYRASATLIAMPGAEESQRRSVIDAMPEASSPGAALVRDMALARFGNDDERAAARAGLRALIDRAMPAARVGGTETRSVTPRWVEAWCRFALGQSLTHETDERERLLGVIELLHLPARFRTEQAYLAGLALAEGISTLSSMGDASGAGVLKHELTSLYPRHPVLGTDAVQRVKVVAPRREEPDELPVE